MPLLQDRWPHPEAHPYRRSAFLCRRGYAPVPGMAEEDRKRNRGSQESRVGYTLYRLCASEF